jgi:hypothetical protein
MQILLQLFLKKRQGAPRHRGTLPDVAVKPATVDEVADDAVRMIHALAARMMQRLAGIVFLVAFERNLRNRRERVREVVDKARTHGNRLARRAVGWEITFHYAPATSVCADIHSRTRASVEPRTLRPFRRLPTNLVSPAANTPNRVADRFSDLRNCSTHSRSEFDCGRIPIKSTFSHNPTIDKGIFFWLSCVGFSERKTRHVIMHRGVRT